MQDKNQANIIYPDVKLKDVLLAFWQGIKPQKWTLFVLVFFVILTNIVTIIIPLFYKSFFDVITSGGEINSVAEKLISIVVQIAILNGFLWTLYRLWTFFINLFEIKTIARLKQQAYDYMIDHSHSFFINNFAGSLVQRINRFARAFETLSDRIIMDVLALLVRIISIIAIVYFFNKWFALIIFIWVAVFLLFNIIFSKWKLKYDILVAETDSKATAYLADTITNQNNISLFSAQKFEKQGYKEVTDKQAKITRFNWDLNSIMEAGQSLLGFAIEFLLFYYAIFYWKQGLITVGIFVMLQAYIFTLIEKLWEFTRVVRQIYQGYADAKEMVEIMLLPHEINDIPAAKKLIVKSGKIEFKNLSFNFNETRQVLKNINIIINPGEKVAIIGPSGAGKTTFVRLILRLYNTTSGKILIDDQDISKMTQESLRDNISLVPQDPVLFHRTLADNISYGKRDAGMQEIQKAASLAHCDEFIKGMPQGFETFVGERGIKLSGGERQRVAIARAILKNAPILVLDEATSSLDSRSEMLIQDALSNLMQNKTVIVIAHRLSTIQKMDRIIVVDDGQIAEQGRHKELLENENSLYKKLWTLQAGGFLADEDKNEDYEKTKNIDDEIDDEE